MKKFEDNDTLLEIELRNIINLNYDGRFNFKCPVCGDGNHGKKRGFLLHRDSQWTYYCHNCNYSSTASFWMKQFFPHNYENYKRELFRLNCNSSNFEKYEDKLKVLISNAKQKLAERTVDESEEIKTFKKITKFEKACEYCQRRKIPESIWSTWFYSIDGLYKDRIVIPYYDLNNQIYYYTGRSLNPKNVIKYMSRKGNNLNSCYNKYNVDESSPVFVLEGPIDSIFVDNSVAMTGFKFFVVDDIKNKYYMFDNDKTGLYYSIKKLQQGEYVFMWKRFLSDYLCVKPIKDVNDFILYNDSNITKLTSDMILKYFTNDIKDKIYFI